MVAVNTGADIVIRTPGTGEQRSMHGYGTVCMTMNYTMYGQQDGLKSQVIDAWSRVPGGGTKTQVVDFSW